jgi:hypothetical protein
LTAGSTRSSMVVAEADEIRLSWPPGAATITGGSLEPALVTVRATTCKPDDDGRKLKLQLAAEACSMVSEMLAMAASSSDGALPWPAS